MSRSKKAHWEPYEQFLTPLRANIIHAPAPRCERCSVKKQANCCMDGLERIFAEHGNDIAAVFFEPQQGEGGYFPLTPASAGKIRELTQKHGALMIADEIQTGIGRTGNWFAFQRLGVVPDVVVFGKAVGGGLPLAGIAAPKELLAKWQPGEHGTTFGGNPLSCAAGLAALKIIEREGLVEYADCLGNKTKARFGEFIGQFGIVDVRGYGLMLGIELRDAEGNADYARCERVKNACREEGLLVLTCGAKIGAPGVDNAAIRLIPPLNIPEATYLRGLDILENALRTVA
jgi:4-aminobutyrate aminotransferase